MGRALQTREMGLLSVGKTGCRKVLPGPHGWSQPAGIGRAHEVRGCIPPRLPVTCQLQARQGREVASWLADAGSAHAQKAGRSLSWMEPSAAPCKSCPTQQDCRPEGSSHMEPILTAHYLTGLWGQETKEAGGVGLCPGPSEVSSGHVSFIHPLVLLGWNSVPVPPHCALMGI